MRAGISTWENRVAPVFDVSAKLLLVEISAGTVQNRSIHTISGSDSSVRILRLSQLGVELLVCGAISRPLLNLIAAANIEVFPFISGRLEEVIKALVENSLDDEKFFMPGCRGCLRSQRLCMQTNNWMEVNMSDQERPGPGGGRAGAGGKAAGPGRGRGGGMNVSGICVCPQCGKQVKHQRGKPCFEQKCPDCGDSMTRGQ